MKPILVIIGPSAAGKSTIADELQQQKLIHLTPIVTERPQRPGELGTNHIFVSKQEFSRRQEKGEILVSVQPFGLPHRYGLEAVKFPVGRVASLILRADFLHLLARHYPNQIIYQIEASPEIAAQRLAQRQPTDIGWRLDDYQRETDAGRRLANRVFINNQPDIKPLVKAMTTALRTDFPRD